MKRYRIAARMFAAAGRAEVHREHGNMAAYERARAWAYRWRALLLAA